MIANLSFLTALIVIVTPAAAVTATFSGHFSNDTPPPMPSSTCSAGQVLVDFNPGNSTAAGTSNFGSFGPSQTHCISPGSPYTGVFTFLFAAGDFFSGTTAGYMIPGNVAGTFNSFVTYSVTGGDGRFLGASGVINGEGILDRRPTRPLNDLTLTGSLEVAGVPEPAAWTLMVGGFGLTGGVLRRVSKTVDSRHPVRS